MRSFIGFFIKQPIWANALIVVCLLFGAYSLSKMNKSFFPELDPKMVTVSVFYPGASPDEMEEGITIKIEQALRGIDGVELINSTSSENMASIVVKGYEDSDIDEIFKEVENAVNSINSFPAGAEKPIVKKIKSNVMSERVSILGLSGECDILTLKKEADKIENDLLSSGLISTIEIMGMPEMELVVEVRENDLLKYNIMIDEISLAIQRNNQDLTGGILRNDKEELIIRSRERTTDPNEIANIVLRTTPDGQKIFIKDVAKVKFDVSETSNEVYYHGKRAINIEVKKNPDQDLGAITNFVQNYVKTYNEENREGKLHIQYESNAQLEKRIDLLTNNGVIGLGLVLLMLGLFLSTRLSLWVAFGIPFSFLGMFIFANMMGLTINMISLFGMILVVGILVDDGIVIAENIYVHFEKGKSPFKAALDGTMEVIPSVFTSVLTTIAAFSILLFVEKMEMMREMPIVVILALAFSLIEAFIVLPVHLASEKVLSKPKEGSRRQKFRNVFDNGISYLRDKIYGDVLFFILKRYRAYVLLPLLFVFFIIYFSGKGIINYTFFPEIKPEVINVEVAFVPGTSKEITKKWLDQAEKAIIESNQEIIDLYGDSLLSDYSMNIGFSQSLGESGFHTGMFTLSIEGEDKDTPVDSLQNRILDKIKNFESSKLAKNYYVGNNIGTFGKPIEYSFSGVEDDVVRKAKDYFKEKLEDLELVNNIKDNEPLGRKEINIEKKAEADFQGLGIYEITKQIRQGVFGQEVQRVIVGTDEVKIWVRYDKQDRKDRFDLENLRIKSMDGKQIMFSEIANYTVNRGPISLKRRDGKREIIVDANVSDPTKVSQINTQITKEILPEIKSKFPTIEITQRGQGERSSKALMSMQINMGILLVIMVLIMSLNFKSVQQALLILLVIPAGIAGGILGHVIVGIPVSILSAFGMIALIGVLINDSIVFLDTYNRNLLEGMSVKDAVTSAAKSRFRPILLTSVTTVAGLLPLIMETSFQAQFLIPMAVSIAFGILFGTIFILLFFPTIILINNDLKRTWNFVMNIDEPPFLGFVKFIITIIFYIISLIVFPIFVLFPNKVFNNFIKLLWRQHNIGNTIDVEPAIMNRKQESDRKLDL